MRCVERCRCSQDSRKSHQFKVGHPVRIGEEESDAKYCRGGKNIRHDKSNDEPSTRTERAKCDDRESSFEAACPRCVGAHTPNNPSGCGSLRNEDSPKGESRRDRIEPHAVKWRAPAVNRHTAGQSFSGDQLSVKAIWCGCGSLAEFLIQTS